ncbi:MAG: hypothetical protein CVV49_01585 [Spirochaetae bacterium HGW-Spirochaetae-5]|nr:MAG: hypothetical protein CVV49_01585 [Spirochaetae bacterium HGW-Spirochaetae-5]
MWQRLINLNLFIFILFVFTGSVLYSGEAEFINEGWDLKFGGYYKNIFTYQKTENFQRDIYSMPEKKKIIADMNRLRFSPEINYGEIFILHADADFETVITNYNKTDYFDIYWRDSGYNEIVTLSREFYYSDDFYIRSDFHNIYVKMTSGKFTGTAGRQQIRFGSSRLWNPLDLMNPISPTGVEGSGEQRGTDALRIDWYPGESTELTGVVSPVKENNNYDDVEADSFNYIARLKSGAKEFDVALLGGYTAKRKNGGADFTAEIFDGLLTGVFLYSSPSSGYDFYQYGTGYEYTFSSGLYLLAEYFYNSLPANDDAELQAALLSYSIIGFDESNYYIISNRIITYNSHYFSIAAGYDFFPLLRGDLFAIYDFQGRGLFLNGALKLNVFENLDITVGIITAFVGDADRGSDFKSFDEQPMYYVSLQFYF